MSFTDECEPLSVMSSSEISDLSPAKLTVDVAVITETDLVTLKCQIPSSASGCTFFTPSETFFEGSCLLRLTGAELLNLTKRRSPATIEVRCFYTEKRGAFNLTSVDSDPSIIEINNLLPPDLSVNSQAITETDSVTLNCQPPVSVTKCNWHFKGKKRAEQFSCSKTLTGAELLRMASQSVPAKVQVWCTYLNGHQSPKSQRMTITVQFPPPELRVNPAVITERDSATLDCVTPSSLSVTECHFYFVRTKTTRSSSCMQTLTAAELLFLSGQSSPAEVQLMCFYPVERDANSLSPHSNISSIHIVPPPELRVNPAVITERDLATLACVTPSSLSVTECHFYFVRTKTTRSSSCMQTLTAAELLLLSGQSSPAEVQLMCFYPVERDANSLSPHSNVSSIHIENQQIHLSNREEWKKLLALPGAVVTVGVIILGLTLFWSNRESDFQRNVLNSQNPDGGLNFNPGNNETFSLVTYLPVNVHSTGELLMLNLRKQAKHNLFFSRLPLFTLKGIT
ncbi:uncharacterized protein LOC111946287 isoform X2 [Oryzias latipes]|uniref:uncharacterized protein LOC111946287 isoform X2 n=1 Tax=Oryzias latipes TaxID=8090 RepID=UPI000CE16EDD|nr:uncharacterized protein LOC111946287 isoform X2 [Oryzias latipes]